MKMYAGRRESFMRLFTEMAFSFHQDIETISQELGLESSAKYFEKN